MRSSREPAVLDLALAAAHHLLIFCLLIFCLFGILSCELIAVRPGMSQTAVAQIVAIDLWYGALAALILIIGFGRAVFAAKGWEYYANNEFFWAKLVVFALIGLISIAPTVRFIRWRRAGGSPDEGDVTTVRRLLYAEVILFALLPVFAAAMARGYGEL